MRKFNVKDSAYAVYEAYANDWYHGPVHLETMYIHIDGKCYQCNRLYSTSFNLPSNEWFEIESMPDGVYFIGNYEKPAKIG